MITKVSVTLTAHLKRRAALFVLLVVSAFTLACGAKEVASAPTEQEALQMIDVLHESGFEVSKEETGEGVNTRYRVMVKQDLFGSDDNVLLATQVLRDNNLPRPITNMESLTRSQGFITAESAQAAQRLKERETEIERQLYTLPNVISADVNIVLGENSSFNFKPYPASAAVAIVHKDPKFALSIEQVQMMVAGSVPDLQSSKVAVALTQKEMRPLPRTSADVRRRTNLIYAFGVGLVLVLAALMLVFYLQTRRQRAQLDELQHEQEIARDNTTPASADAQDTDHRWLPDRNEQDAAAKESTTPAT